MSSPSSKSMDTSAVTIGSSVGAVIILLLTVVVVVLIVLKGRTAKSSKKERALFSKGISPDLGMDTWVIIVVHSKLCSFTDDGNRSVELQEQLCWQLRHKNMIISKSQIHLSSTIGQGSYLQLLKCSLVIVYLIYTKGEYGLVFKGYVNGSNIAAIKTSKGRTRWNMHWLMCSYLFSTVFWEREREPAERDE